MTQTLLEAAESLLVAPDLDAGLDALRDAVARERGAARAPTYLKAGWKADGAVVRDERHQLVAVVAQTQAAWRASLIASAPDLLALAVRVAAHFEGTDAPLGVSACDLVARIRSKEPRFCPSGGGDGQRHEDRADRLFGGAAARQRAENGED